MKPGDLIAWNSKAAGAYHLGPKEGDYCGFLLEMMSPSAFVGEMDRDRRDRYERIHPRVKVLDDDGEILITRKEYVKVI